MASSDLDAFDAAWRYLETLARQSTGARDTDTALAELRSRGEISPGEHSQLDGARKIRNAMTHSALLPGNVPLAVPTGALVELLRIVTSRLSKQPPRIGDLAGPAHQVTADMPVHAALQDLIARNFSQAPYKTPGGEWQLFTAEQVARWLALHDDGPVTLTGTTVADLAEFGPAAPAGRSSRPPRRRPPSTSSSRRSVTTPPGSYRCCSYETARTPATSGCSRRLTSPALSR